jgi:hypothetical protein
MTIRDDSGRVIAPPQTSPAPSLHFRIECSWCKQVLEQGTPGAPVSHGICAACSAVATGELEQYALGAAVAQAVLGRRG